MWKPTIAIILVLISVTIAGLLVYPAYGDMIALKEKQERFASALEKADQIDKKSKELSAKLNSISEDDIDQLNRLLPSDFDKIRLLNDLSGIAAVHGISTTNASIIDSLNTEHDVQRERKDYSEITIDLSVTAKYKTFIEYLKDIASSLQLLSINSVSFSAHDQDDEYNFNIKATTYKFNKDI